MQIKYFTPQDLFYSETAIENHINNFPSSFEILDNLIYSAQQTDKIREFLGHPIYPTSWFRCLELNRLVDSKDNSQHVKGEAIDFICPSYGTPEKVCSGILDSGILFDQLIWERKGKKEWVHCSFSKTKNRKQFIEILANQNLGKIEI